VQTANHYSIFEFISTNGHLFVTADMKKVFITFCLSVLSNFTMAQSASELVESSLSFLKRSDLSSAKTQLEKIKDYPFESLKSELQDQQVAKAFWLNYYNATVQVLLIEDPSLYDDRGSFFSKKWVIVAGQELSLDDIEHGIIRGSKHKYTLGYTTKFFVEDFEETFRLEQLDYRVHFALNCGAVSCPPVAIYDAGSLDKQLDISSERYLRQEVRYDPSKKRITIPILCQWFYADFGKESGIREMLNQYLSDYEISEKARISYLDYDWTISTGNFIDLDE
jgi:hypothetical protein